MENLYRLMGSFVFISLLSASTAAFLGFAAENAEASTGLNVARLRCEYRIDPEGIDVRRPRLSWVVTSDQRGQRQTAYRILAASSRDLLRQDKSDLWETGKVASDRTLHIEYEGDTLQSHQECYWKVRVWDKDGKPSSWSSPARWSMGILSPEEWRGQWLGYARPYTTADEKALRGSWRQEAISPLFRKTFEVTQPVRRAYLYICGLGYHEVRLNGSKVGDHVLDPAFTRYDRSCLYVTHDVTEHLHPGANALGVMLGNGWYNVFTHAAWDFHQAPWRDKPKLLAQLRIEYTDGAVDLICSDESWKATTGPIVLDGIRQGETYDARREMTGWCRADYDDSRWAKPQVVTPPAGKLRAQLAPPIKVMETITPVSVSEPAEDVYLFDLGQNIAGWCRLRVKGPAGTVVKIRYGERLDDKGMLEVAQIKQHVKDEVFQTDTYILKGQGVETWEPRFTYHGFQYIEITGYPGRPELEDVQGQVVHTAFEQTGQFSCSNDLLNRIQQCALWSYRGNYHGYPTDCPHREKNGWTGDAHLAAEMAMYNFGNGAGYTKWMLDFHDEQKPGGELPGIIPTAGWGYHWGNGPAWDSAYLIIPWQMYRYYGDTGILAHHYERFKRYVDYLGTQAKEHIVSIGLGDWVPAQTETPVAVTSTAFYYLDARITAGTAALLGKEAEAEKYSKLAEAIKAAFHETFYRGEGIYANGSQTALSFALFYDLAPASEREKVLDRLVENIQARDYHIDTGILGAKTVFNVLSENGEHETAYRMATQTTAPSYGDWILQGATTLWEDWPGKNSRNHIMFGDISAWFYRNLAGVRLDEEVSAGNAFKHFVIRPQPTGDLNQVSASCQSVRGMIESRWKIDKERFYLTVRVPANTTATVYVPAGDERSVTESGRRILGDAGVQFLRRDGEYVVYSVVSGVYHFESINEK